MSEVLYLKKTYKRSNLINLFVKRDLAIKYSQSILGVGWVLIQPLTGMVIFSLFFSHIMKLGDSKIGVPYPLYCFSGYICWLLFSNILNGAGTSLQQEEGLLKKVYFPRLLLPISKTLIYVFDFAVSLVVLILIALFYEKVLILRIFLVIPSVFLLILNGFAMAVWLCSLTIKFKDFNHIIPFLTGFGIWITPVFYSTTQVPYPLKWFVDLNPLTYSIDLFRGLLFGMELPVFTWVNFLVQIFFIFILVFGVKYFIKVDKLISDYL